MINEVLNKKKLSDEEKNILKLERANLLYFLELMDKYKNVYPDS